MKEEKKHPEAKEESGKEGAARPIQTAPAEAQSDANDVQAYAEPTDGSGGGKALAEPTDGSGGS